MHPKLAHYISNLGNPLLTIPVFSVIALFQTEEPKTALFVSLLIVVGIVVPILIKSYRGVQKGKYTNYDISNKAQRQSWYLFPTLLLAAVTLILFLTDQSQALRMGVAGALALFIFAQILNLYIKTSLHVGFNTYLAFLIFPFNWVVGVGTLVFSFFLGWSRIVLKRHTLAEVVSGALLGLVVGGLMLWARGW